MSHARYCVHGPRHREVAEELVRREVERCDRLAGLMAMMSVAGGTGSGVGTYVTQCLRDIYPKSFILNHLTWPYGTGEVWRWLSVCSATDLLYSMLALLLAFPSCCCFRIIFIGTIIFIRVQGVLK